MTAVSDMFADLSRALEDLYGVAVEGTASDLSPDLQCVLLRNLRYGIVRLDRKAVTIALAMRGAKP
jgi:hypothetical protein